MGNTFTRPNAAAKQTNLSLRKYLYYSTLVGVFSARLTFHIGVGIRVFDLVMVANLFAMFLFLDVFRMPAWIPYLILYLAVSGGIGIANGTDSFSQVGKEFLGISVSLLYYYFFFKLIRNDFERAFLAYARIGYWFVLIAIPLWAASCITAHQFLRLNGLASEPAAFCEVVLPAYYWYASSYFTSRKHATEFIVFTLAIILSQSSLGFLSVAFGSALLLLSGRRKHILAIPIVAGGLFGLAYSLSHDFKERVDGSVLAAATGDVTGTNLSAYALLSNVFVTQHVLRESPLLGNGLGSHPISHKRFIGDIPGISAYIENGWVDYNSTEASSLTLRVLSELGILGFSGVLVFLFHFHVGGSGSRAAISNGILVTFFLKLIRGGLYFQPEQFFFVFVYILNYRKFMRESRATVRTALRNPSIAPLMES